MKMIMRVLLAAATAAAVLTGCMGGVLVKKDRVAETGRIALVSVVMPQIADTAQKGNRRALQSFVEQALIKDVAELKTVRNWTVVDPATSKGASTVMSLGAISDTEIAAVLPPGGDLKAAGEAIDRELAQWKEGFIGARSLPVIPYSGVVPDKDGKTARAMIPAVIQKQAAGLCGELNVDAVAFVHVSVSITHPRAKTFIVSGNRTDGTLRMAQTMVIVDKTGRIIVDMGRPMLDARARSRDLLPLYAGAGQVAVKRENIELSDPKNKIARAFFSLIDETSADMINILRKAAGEK
jgi:hypothetical protein